MLARADEIDAAIVARLASGWTMDRLDRTMKAILRPVYELIARSDVPVGAVVSEYVDVAGVFDGREAGFANGLPMRSARMYGRTLRAVRVSEAETRLGRATLRRVPTSLDTNGIRAHCWARVSNGRNRIHRPSARHCD